MNLHPGQTALVIGLGTAGLSTVRFLVRQGLRVRVSDKRALDQIAPELVTELQQAGVLLEAGEHSLAALTGVDWVIPSPGVPLDLPMLQAARTQGLPIIGELALAAGRFKLPLIAVTGSNGKTTVTSLIGHLLRVAGKKPFVGGNIGTPLLDFFADPDAFDAVVLELSSFQLDLAGAFRPDIGLLLNISPDHLDRHGTLAAYTQAKQKIFCAQRDGDCAILGMDDSVVVATTSLNSGVRCCGFGFSAGCKARIADSQVILHLEDTETAFDLRATRLHSSVNQLNAAAALLAARLFGCAPDALQQGLASFNPPPHRMAEVATFDGVRFINDSKATNIGALAAALAGCDAPVILIAGGRDKGSDYRLLHDVVRHKVKHLLLIGEAATLMQEALGTLVPTATLASMAEAVQTAKAIAVHGDVVLLAPGCASFDMFSGYAERGRVFSDEVLRLQEQANSILT
jgi:UDP-N-acetylmuramoylalanine--D-glutamate ligase